MRPAVRVLCFGLVCLATGFAANPPAWIQRSNENAKIALAPIIRFSPDGAASLGIEGNDEAISDFGPNRTERVVAAERDAVAELRKRREAEKDPLIRQDLDIMIDSLDRDIRSEQLTQKYRIPYLNLAQAVFGGVKTLLDDQVAASRRPAALVRLRRDTGLEKGYEPLAVLAERRTREKLNVPGLVGPARDQVTKDLQNASFFIEGIGQLFAKYKIDGYEEPLAKLKEQIASYNDFIRREVMPKAMTDFRLPPELYANALRNYGVDIAPADLAAMAHKAFTDFQTQANEVARVVAREKGINATD